MIDNLITFIASYLLWIMFAGALVLWIIDGRKRKEQALHAVFSSIIVWVTSEMIKALFPTSRPFLLNGNGIKTATLHFDSSFPSAHTAVAFALAATIYLHDKKSGRLFVGAAVLVGLGRVLANVHFPTDVLFGAALGWAVSVLLVRLHLFNLVKTK